MNYTNESFSVLMDISKSTSLYLHDENSTYRVLAIDLCSRGFHVWQHYVDAMEILRCLFNIATSCRKDSISLQNTGSQARLAVLSIASDHMPLLMNTLCLDVLSPPTMEHRRSVLQVVAFLIKKVILSMNFIVIWLISLIATFCSTAPSPSVDGSRS